MVLLWWFCILFWGLEAPVSITETAQKTAASTFFKRSHFVFHSRKTVIQVWNDIKVNKWWQNFNFCPNNSFKSTLWPLAHLKFVFFVFGALVKWAVVAKSPDVVNLIEALDVVGDAVALQDVMAVWDWCDSIDLKICMKVRQGTCNMCCSSTNAFE